MPGRSEPSETRPAESTRNPRPRTMATLPFCSLRTRSPTPARPGRRALVLALALLVTGACSPADGGTEGVGSSTRSGHPADTQPPSRDRLPPRGHAWVIFGSDTVRAEVASTAGQREEGLMYREHLEAGTGMLFVFDDEAIRSFWMKNTFVPLDIAYLDSSMRIVDIQQMEPRTEELYESSDPAMFALEVPQGWFEEQGIREGDPAEIVFGPR